MGEKGEFSFGTCCVCETTQPVSKMKNIGGGSLGKHEGTPTSYEVDPHGDCKGRGTIPTAMNRMIPSAMRLRDWRAKRS